MIGRNFADYYTLGLTLLIWESGQMNKAARFLAGLSILLCPLATGAAELAKSDAEKLLTAMGDTNVVVGAVINGLGAGGLGANSSPNSAFVIGYAERGGKPKKIEQTFLYDKDIGWFYYEVDLSGKRVRLWTVRGYRELRPTAK